jgi:hypothetical protein
MAHILFLPYPSPFPIIPGDNVTAYTIICSHFHFTTVVKYTNTALAPAAYNSFILVYEH